MIRTLRSFVLLTFFVASMGMAQDSFDAKKHKKTTVSSKTAQPKAFNLTPLQSFAKSANINTAKQGVQLPTIFNSINIDPQFKHAYIWRDQQGKSVFIKSKLTDAAKRTMAKKSSVAIAKTYLMELGSMLKVQNADSEFQMISEVTDDLGQQHLKMQQVFKGIPVYGSEIIIHINGKTNEIAVNGTSNATPKIADNTPKISMANAITAIEADLGKKLPGTENAKSNSISIPAPVDELVLYPLEDEMVLTRHITVYANLLDRWEYFIDAQTGKVVHKYYHTCTLVHKFHEHDKTDGQTWVSPEFVPPTTGSGIDLNGVNRPLNTFNQGGVNYLINTTKPMFNAGQSNIPQDVVGGIMTWDIRNERPVEGTEIFLVTSTTNSWTDRASVSSQYNADVAFEYFRNTFNRNSINGQGGSVISIINVADPNTGGGLDNAFWNGQWMLYGNGNVGFSALAGSLDVGGHEMSHGVIQNTANLQYQGQSGAMNESFADIFGVMIDRDDWLLGEDIVNTQYFPSGAMRDMSDPNNGAVEGQNAWQPKDMTEFVVTNEDNGGVHSNSGIPNRAYYLFATAIGKDKAEQIFYRTLTTYLTASSQFVDLRLGVIQAATDLHGANSPEVLAAQNAFDTVGITDGAATDTDNDIPIATGSEFILSVDVSPSNDNSLYISDTNGENYVPLTTTILSRKPSVADDGSFAIYVTADNTINAVTLDQNNIEEFVISDEPLWAAVSLSKDGSKLAAVRTDIEGVVFISDILTAESQVFELYNPTTAEGINTGEVRYADALEWDYSGQLLIYDAYNELENSSGLSVDYWDVGVMRVWNNQTNTFGDGVIQKIFTNLPEGVSIGNPSFAKTSGNILAFDLFNDNDNSYEVITANIETGDVVTVYNNNKLGFPNFATNDRKLLFDTDNNTEENIAVIDIAADKLSPVGSPSALIPNGIWGIWYTVGDRATASADKDITDFRFNVTNPASIGVINGTSINVSIPNNINPQGLIATFANSARSQVYIGDVLQQSGVNANDFTNPVNYTVVAEDGSSKVFTVSLGNALPVDPNDDDGDGVPNDMDQCPNTITGSIVDVFGCPKFSLPSTNFSILSQGESCIDTQNGSITVTAQQNLNYTANLSGNGIDRSQNFNTNYTFNDLSTGNYTLCFTVQGQPGYQLCYEIFIERPQALSVTGKVDDGDNYLTLKMSGGERYFITHNNEFFSTTAQEVKLKLATKKNNVTVTTDKDCQGVYDAEFLMNEGIKVVPNPIVDGVVNILVPVIENGDALIQIGSVDGQMILSTKMALQNGSLAVPVNQLTKGVYILYVTIESETTTQKIFIK